MYFLRLFGQQELDEGEAAMEETAEVQEGCADGAHRRKGCSDMIGQGHLPEKTDDDAEMTEAAEPNSDSLQDRQQTGLVEPRSCQV